MGNYVKLLTFPPRQETLHIPSLLSKSCYSMEGTSNFSGWFKCARALTNEIDFYFILFSEYKELKQGQP